MARVTVEDCVQVVNNRYELVLLSAQRARDVAAGAPITVDRDNDKNPVVALREIAKQTINLQDLRRHIAGGVNRQVDVTSEDEELQALSGTGLEGMDLSAFDQFSEMEEVTFEDADNPAPEVDENEDVPEVVEDEVDALEDKAAEEGEDDILAANA